jgi:TIR domain
MRRRRVPYEGQVTAGEEEGGMLDPELIAVLSNAAVSYAASDATAEAWQGARHTFARLLSRGDPLKEQQAEQRLDETRQQLAESDSEEARAELARQWSMRLTDLLEEQPSAEAALRALIEEIQAQLRASGEMSGADHSVVTGRNMNIMADRAGITARVIHKDVGSPRPTGQGRLVTPTPSPYRGLEFGGGKARLFISYSHRDDRYREQLITHLAGMRRQGVIADWHDRKIVPGKEWRDAIDQNLDAADCVLLLVSPDFLASDYCYSIEMQRTLEKHREGRVLVIPVIVRPADWQHTPLGDLEALPKDAKPVVEWARRDRAWLSVAEGIRRALSPVSGDLHKSVSYIGRMRQRNP